MASQLGNLLIKSASLLVSDVKPKTTAVVIAAVRSDKAKFVAPTSQVAASAVLGSSSSVWFNAKVGAGSKIGQGACILDGAQVEENCTLGEMCVVKPGAIVKKGSTLGPRVVVGVGATIPEKSSIKENTILPDGWNGKTVSESTVNATAAEEEVTHVLNLASQHQAAWSRTEDERDALLLEMQNRKANPVPGEKWDTFVSVNPNPNRNPERRGLIFDK